MTDLETSQSAAVSVSRQQFDDMKLLANAVCEIADGLGIDGRAIEAVRRRAIGTSTAEQLEELCSRMAGDRLAALRQSRTPARDVRRDGSKPTQPPERGWQDLERQNFIAENHYSQVLAHQAMAQAAAPPGDADAHASTRPFREQLYKQLAQEAME